MASVWKSWCVLVTALHLLHITSSNFMVDNLPGFGKLPFMLETGYVGVGEREEVQLFYYFVESERNPMNDPLLLWLVGGPGCSALASFFYENGPLKFNYDNVNGSFPELQLNPNAWTKVLNILYIDAPVGTGFSYSKTQQGYYSNDKQWVEHMYDFLQKWLVDHPKFRSNQLYIGGGSYSGMIVTPLVQKVYEGYKAGNLPLLNIQGFVLASPSIDSYQDINTRVQYAHQRTLVSNELYESIKASCNGDYISLNPNNANCMSDYEAYSESVRYINMFQIMQPSCIKGSHKNQRRLFENLETIHQSTFRCQEEENALVELWANDPNVQKNLNVREGTKGHFERCNNISDTYTKNVHSVVEYHQNLTSTNLRSLIYIGDLDMSIPYLSTHSIIKSLNLNLNSTWRPWFTDGEVAGYTERYKKNEYHLTYATVKGGGHVAQEYSRKEIYEMIHRWFSYYDI
ncbi:serine carboxypeptidase-like 17 [Gastrolobium bilobum]|uniref:serine carboxypeptidase-like 17 n=1 Tax=Gastrolobium bilobum TaxID=150636 RepID=UPI002AAFD13F|nr:serine carboxypeptidase-like 17 [Gastrolobium bilobum]